MERISFARRNWMHSKNRTYEGFSMLEMIKFSLITHSMTPVHNKKTYKNKAMGENTPKYNWIKHFILRLCKSFDNPPMGIELLRQCYPGPIFKRADILPPNFVKFLSHEIGYYDDRMSLTFDRQASRQLYCRNACPISKRFKSVKPKLAASSLQEILQWDVLLGEDAESRLASSNLR